MVTTLEDRMLDSKVEYRDHDSVREPVQEVIWQLVSDGQRTLFPHVCGRCGNSCRRPDILVREADILRLRQRLDLTHSEFRDRYLTPASTWNPGDGLLKLQGGACPFLEAGEEPAPGTATCTVYSDRPADCRRFVSKASFCLKQPGHLIGALAEVRLEIGGVEVELKDGSLHRLPAHRPWWDSLKAALEPIEANEQDRYQHVLGLVREQIEDMVDEFQRRGVVVEHERRLKTARERTDSLTRLADHRPDQAEAVQELWRRVLFVEDLLAGRVQLPAEVPEVADHAPDPDLPFAWLQLGEAGLTALYKVPDEFRHLNPVAEVPIYLPYAAYPEMTERARDLMRVFLSRDYDPLQTLLTEKDPPCFMCGECCRIYAVRITPNDIDRLVEHLVQSREEFLEQSTLPDRFSWNRMNRILGKRTRTGKRLFYELPVAGQAAPGASPSGASPSGEEVRECIFLQQREDGPFYCGVYEHRPEVCRLYTTSTALCRRTNQLPNWGRQAAGVLWLKVTGHDLSVLLEGDLGGGRGPRTFGRAQWPEGDAAAGRLQQVVALVLEEARASVRG